MKEREHPLVSVIIPNFNRGNLIAETIDSIIKQTYINWEAIIVDDRSTDNSIAVVNKFQELDSRIKLIVRDSPPKGAPVCRNIGLKHAQGEYIIFLDSDDLINESCLEKRVSIACSNPSLEFLVFYCLLFKEHTNDYNILWNVFTEENDLDRFLKLDVPWQTGAVLYKKSIFQKHGDWDETLLSFQDWELAVRLIINNTVYQKFEIQDCFWRFGQNDTIGVQSKSKEHLQSHEGLFLKVSESLEKLNLYNGKRKLIMAGLYFWLIEMWLVRGEFRKPFFLWTIVHRLRLISIMVLLQGFVYFALYRIKALRNISKRIIRKLWPVEILKRSSPTFRKVRV